MLYIFEFKIIWLFLFNSIIIVLIVVIFELNVKLCLLFFNVVIMFFIEFFVGFVVWEYLYFWCKLLILFCKYVFVW